MLLGSLIFVELIELYNLHGERPPAIFRRGRRRCDATLLDNSGRRGDH